MTNPTNIPAPRVPITDDRTGLMSREWYRFFTNLFNQIGVNGNTTSIQDLEISASGLAADSLTEMQKSLQDLQLSLLPQIPSTGGGTTYSVFTSTTNGLAPASGGGTSNFLRADGTWAVPPGTGGGITDGDKGDITVSGGATVWTIDAGVVSNSKLANVSTATFKGRTTAGTGSPEDLTGTQATALLDVFSSTLKGLAPSSGGGTTNFLRADGTWAAPPSGGVTDGDKGDITVSSSGTVWTIDAGVVSNSKLANVSTATFKGRTTAGTGSPEDLTGTQATALLDTFTSTLKGLAPSSGGGTTNFLRADGTWAAPPSGGVTDGDKGDITVSSSGTVWTIDAGVVSNTKLANVATATFKGRATAGTGSPEDLTGTQATALLDTFTSTLKGLAPSSGGGTSNYLRADGTWATPPGTGGVSFANPTASVGLTAVNGVATSAMRSDAAPALDVSIAPTWTGLHTFSQSVTSTASTTGSSTTGAYTYGALSYSDQNNLLTLQSSVNTYAQLVLQNTSALSSASSDLTISNNNGTSSTFYGNFGMNSSGWAGTAGTASLSAPNMVYLTATSADITVGTTTSNSIRFVVAGGADAATIDTSSRLGIGVTSPTAMLHLKAGTATANTAPLKFNSGTNLTTAEAGAMEYNGSLLFMTPTGTARALSPTKYFYRKNTSTSLNNVTGAQSWLGLTSGVTLAANTIYHFCGEFQLSTTTTSAHTEAHGFALTTATVTNISYSIVRRQNQTTAQQIFANYFTATTATAVTNAISTTQNAHYRIEGTIAIGTGGQVNPQITFNTAGPGAGSTIAIGAWIQFTPIGATGSNVSIGTWS